MPALIRSVVVKRGPHFWFVEPEEEGDERALMFEYVVDGSTKHGPREATDDDRDMFHEALAECLAGEPAAVNPPLVVATDPPDGKPEAPEKPFARRRDATRE